MPAVARGRHGFGDVAFRELGTGRAAPRTNPAEPVVRAVLSAVEKAFGHRPLVYPFLPGTSPMDLLIADGIPALSGPAVGHPSSNIHAPNENIFLADYVKTIKGIATLLNEFAQA